MKLGFVLLLLAPLGCRPRAAEAPAPESNKLQMGPSTTAEKANTTPNSNAKHAASARALSLPSAPPPTTAPAPPVGMGRRAPNLNRLMVSDGHTCFIGNGGESACWGGWGVTRISAPLSAFVDQSTAITADGRYVEFHSMKARAVDTRSGDSGREPHYLPPVIDVELLGSSGAGCAIRAADSAVECWAQTISHPSPTPPKGAFVDLVTDGGSICGLRPSGTVECFAGVEAAEALPQPEGTFVQIASFCGLRENGSVACWWPGDNSWTANVPKLQRLYSEQGPGVCGLDVTGKSGCWSAARAYDREPIPVAYDDLSLDSRRACGLRNDRVECWGFNQEGALDPPAAIGTYLKDRSYRFGSSSLPYDATVPPLPQNKLPANCKETSFEELPESATTLLGKLRHAGPHDPQGRLNLAKRNRDEPLLYRCGSEYQLRWYFVSLFDGKERTDFTITVPSAATLRAFEAKYESSREHGSAPDPQRRNGHFIHARQYRGGHAIMTWNVKNPDPTSERLTGTATLQASMDGLLVNEFTNAPSFDLPMSFAGYVLSVQAISKAAE